MDTRGPVDMSDLKEKAGGFDQQLVTDFYDALFEAYKAARKLIVEYLDTLASASSDEKMTTIEDRIMNMSVDWIKKDLIFNVIHDRLNAQARSLGITKDVIDEALKK